MPFVGQEEERKTPLSQKLSAAFHQETATVVPDKLIEIVADYPAVDLAYAASRLPANARPLLYEQLADLPAKIDFISHTDTSTRTVIFRHLSDGELKELVEKMSLEEAVKLVEDLSDRRFRRLAEQLEPSKAAEIKEMRRHASESAARLMSREFFAFPEEMTIEEAAVHIRDNPGIELMRTIFVHDQGGKLVGYVPERNLIVNRPHLLLGQVMRPILHKVHPETAREEVVEIAERYKLATLPVIDLEGCLVGVITAEDVVDALEDMADETLAKMAGITEKVRHREPLMKRFFSRTPWLLFTLLAGLVNVGVMSSFQSFEGGILTFVLFFVPLITGMSGNIGIQCSTVLVRGMATGSVAPGHRTEAAMKEMAIGLIIGLAFGVGCGLIVYGFDQLIGYHPTIPPAVVGVIVGTGLFGACLTGTLLGVLSPFFFSRVGVDPAVASGPIVTAVNDFLSMTIYFFIAMGLRALLV